MLVSFKIENFRSIRDEVEFSTIASTGSSHLSDHLINIDDENFKLVRSSGFYGPNASGKSNVLRAFAALKYLVTDTGDLKENNNILCYEPYELSADWKIKPTKFEIDFYVNGLRYIYKIQFSKNIIHHESLDCYFSKIPSNLFLRDSSGWENIKFGHQFKGGVKKVPFFDNNAYLSKISNTASSPEIVKGISDFFSVNLVFVKMDTRPELHFLMNKSIRKTFSDTTGKFLSLVDTGITGMSVEENDVDIKLPDGIPEETKREILFRNKVRFLFSHKNENGEDVMLDQENESDGTNRLFDLSPAITSALCSFKVLIIDEIDHSLHPHLASIILRLFNDSELNKFNSQLIFSTHNMDLMKPEKMRRDQLWFAEKFGGNTNIFSLDDFEKDKVKASSPFHKWYDEGRFGSTPSVNYAGLKKYFMNIQSMVSKDDPKITNHNNGDDVFGQVEDF